MKAPSCIALALALAGTADAFTSFRARVSQTRYDATTRFGDVRRPAPKASRDSPSTVLVCGSRVARARTAPSMGFDMEASIQETKDLRLKHLEEQAMLALKLAVENHEHPVFPNAMVSGRCRQA